MTDSNSSTRRHRGYFPATRGITNHPFFRSDPFSKRDAWRWLEEHAAFKDLRVEVGSARHRHIIPIRRGQLSYSIRFLAERWNWTRMQVSRFLAAIKQLGWIETATTEGQTVIIVNNYGAGTQYGTQSGTQSDAKNPCHIRVTQNGISESGTQYGTQSGTNKKNDEEEGRKKDISTAIKPDGGEKNSDFSAINDSGSRIEFDSGREINAVAGSKNKNSAHSENFVAWFEVYVHRPGLNHRDKAAAAYRAVLATGEISHDELMARTQVFAKERKAIIAKDASQSRYTPVAANWLNNGGYRNVRVPPPPDVSRITDRSWAIAIDQYRKAGPSTWPESYYGPPPGEFGCLAPAYLLGPEVPTWAFFSNQDWRDCLKALGQWKSDWGPSPGEPGCRVPNDLLREFQLGEFKPSAPVSREDIPFASAPRPGCTRLTLTSASSASAETAVSW